MPWDWWETYRDISRLFLIFSHCFVAHGHLAVCAIRYPCSLGPSTRQGLTAQLLVFFSTLLSTAWYQKFLALAAVWLDWCILRGIDRLSMKCTCTWIIFTTAYYCILCILHRLGCGRMSHSSLAMQRESVGSIRDKARRLELATCPHLPSHVVKDFVESNESMVHISRHDMPSISKHHVKIFWWLVSCLGKTLRFLCLGVSPTGIPFEQTWMCSRWPRLFWDWGLA